MNEGSEFQTDGAEHQKARFGSVDSAKCLMENFWVRNRSKCDFWVGYTRGPHIGLHLWQTHQWSLRGPPVLKPIQRNNPTSTCIKNATLRHKLSLIV